MHNAFLNIDNHKMSKSAGNFFTVRDIEKQYDPQVLRYFMLTVQYRSPLNFSRDLMEAAKTSYERICNCAANLNYLLERKGVKASEIPGAVTDEKAVAELMKTGMTDAGMTSEESAKLAEADSYRVNFEKAMDDDFNTADAISACFDLVKWININVDENSSVAFMETLLSELKTLTGILGLVIEKDKAADNDDLAAYVDGKIAERQAARKAKDFAKADAIRDELKEKGIVLEDTKDGVKWKKA
jgi:cysteinyl-tRNA synthetase